MDLSRTRSRSVESSEGTQASRYPSGSISCVIFLNLQGRTVLLEGLGSSQFCVSTPRLGDTKIFLVDHILDEKKRRNGLSVPKLKLRSSILKVNLRNLKVLWRLEESKTKGQQSKSSPEPPTSSLKIQKVSDGEPVSSRKGATCDFACALHHQPVCGADKVLVSFNLHLFV